MTTDYQRRVAEIEATLAASAATNGSGTRSAAPEPFLLEVMTARAVCELPDPPTSDQLLGTLIVRGQRVVLAGGTGDGKTTMASHVVRAVADKADFLGFTGSGGRCLIIDAEQGLRTIKRRLVEAGLDHTDHVDYIRVPDGLRLDTDERHIAELERVFQEGSYALVSADPLYKLHAGDSNDERSAVDLMRRFDRFRTAYDFALLTPAHIRKPTAGAKFTINEVFGSTAYTRGAEIVLGLQRVRPGYSRLHFFKDRDGDLPIGDSWGLLFDREGGYRRDPEDTADRKSAADQIRDLVEADPGITQKQLQEATGYAERTVRKALREINATPTGATTSLGEKGWQLAIEDDQ